MNSTQLKNVLTIVSGIIATWLASKLNFLGLDQATWTTLVSTIIFSAVTVVVGYFNKSINLIDTVGKEPGTTVVTTPANAQALPENKDVVPVTPAIASAVKASQ